MPSVYNFSPSEIIAFSLILIRLSAFIVSWPVFGIETLPAPIKILFALVIAMLVFPVIDWSKAQITFESTQLIWMAVREAFIGVVFGFLARMFFMATRVAGEIISVSMGLAGAQLYNPAMGGQSSALDQMLYSLAALVFLAINGHHLFLTGIVDSFRIIPLGVDLLSAAPFMGVAEMVQETITAGIKMGAPVMVAIFVVNLVMGVLGKTVPQINVLITSLAVNVLVGLVVLLVALPMMLNEMPDLMEESSARLFKLVREM